jgi:hypothetical protein
MGKDKKRNKSGRAGGHNRNVRRAVSLARRLKVLDLIVKDLNRLADWLNGVSVVQMATVQSLQDYHDQKIAVDDPNKAKAFAAFQFKESIDKLVLAHVQAQQQAQPVPVPDGGGLTQADIDKAIAVAAMPPLPPEKGSADATDPPNPAAQ